VEGGEWEDGKGGIDGAMVAMVGEDDARV